MNNVDFTHIIPLLITAGTAVLIMIQAAIHRSRSLPSVLAIIGLLAAIVSTVWIGSVEGESTLFVNDSFGYFFQGLALFGAILVTWISPSMFKHRDANQEEYYILLLLSTLGAQALIISHHFVALFVGLELLSLGLFGLIAYVTDERRSLEASMKYLLMASVSTAFLLFGMSVIYGMTGSMLFGEIGAVALEEGMSLPLAGGLALFLVGAGFKLALAPFHLWAPDVYQGARSPVTAFIATVSKAAVFVVFFRFFLALEIFDMHAMYVVIAVLAVASMIMGNILALLQNNVKRILAFSSIAHLGYLMVAFITGSAYGIESAGFYFLAYFMTIIGAFGIVLYYSKGDEEQEQLESYRGMFWRDPVLAAIFTVVLLSLAGIPLTAGFFGKYYILLAGVESDMWLLVTVLVLSSVIGLFYYLRIVITMISPAYETTSDALNRPKYLFGLLGVLAVLIVFFGLYPTPAIEFIQQAVQALF